MSDPEYDQAIVVLRRAASLGFDPWRVAVALGVTLRSHELGAPASNAAEQGAPDEAPNSGAGTVRPDTARPSA